MPYVKNDDWNEIQRELNRSRALAAAEEAGENAGTGIEDVGRALGSNGGASFNTGAGAVGGMRKAYRAIGREGGAAALRSLED